MTIYMAVLFWVFLARRLAEERLVLRGKARTIHFLRFTTTRGKVGDELRLLVLVFAASPWSVKSTMFHSFSPFTPHRVAFSNF